MGEKLSAFRAGKVESGVFRGQEAGRPPIAFLFTGQGSQYPGMGRLLYDTQPTFRKALDRCDEILRGHLEKPLTGILYPARNEQQAQLLNETAYTQPALFSPGIRAGRVVAILGHYAFRRYGTQCRGIRSRLRCRCFQP